MTQLGYCTEDDIARIMAQKSGYRYVSINEIGVNVAAANLITPEMALRNNVLPLYQEDKTLYVAMKNPNDIITIDNLHLMTGLEICPLVVADMELAAAIENFANMNSSVENYDDDDQTEAVEETEELTLDDKPAVQLVNQIINNAIKSGASDVHIEALEKICASVSVSTAFCRKSCKTRLKSSRLSFRVSKFSAVWTSPKNVFRKTDVLPFAMKTKRWTFVLRPCPPFTVKKIVMRL